MLTIGLLMVLQCRSSDAHILAAAALIVPANQPEKERESGRGASLQHIVAIIAAFGAKEWPTTHAIHTAGSDIVSIIAPSLLDHHFIPSKAIGFETVIAMFILAYYLP